MSWLGLETERAWEVGEGGMHRRGGGVRDPKYYYLHPCRREDLVCRWQWDDLGGWRPGGGTGLKKCSFITHLVDVQEVEEGHLDGQGAVEELLARGDRRGQVNHMRVIRQSKQVG